MSLSFAKETVVSVQPASSLLSSTLSSATSSHSLGATLRRSGASTGAVGDASTPTPPAAHDAVAPAAGSDASRRSLPSFTVAQVISAVLNSYHSEHSSLALGLSSDASRYDLRIAEDDGTVDPDFPSVDYAVPITSVGVDKFVLCEINTDKSVLRISIPLQSVQLRVCEADSTLPELVITCYQPLTAGSKAIGFVPSHPHPRANSHGEPIQTPTSTSAAPSSSPEADAESLVSALGSASLHAPAAPVKQFTVRLHGFARAT